LPPVKSLAASASSATASGQTGTGGTAETSWPESSHCDKWSYGCCVYFLKKINLYTFISHEVN